MGGGIPRRSRANPPAPGPSAAHVARLAYPPALPLRGRVRRSALRARQLGQGPRRARLATGGTAIAGTAPGGVARHTGAQREITPQAAPVHLGGAAGVTHVRGKTD